MADREVLKRIPFFAEVLDDQSLAALAEAAKRVEYDRGSVLIREHDPGKSMFVIFGGAVNVAIRDGGKDRRVATLGDGDVVGEMSLLTGARRTATVTALKPTVTLEITRSALEPILATAPSRDGRTAEDQTRRPLWPSPLAAAGWPGSQIADRMRRFFARLG